MEASQVNFKPEYWSSYSDDCQREWEFEHYNEVSGVVYDGCLDGEVGVGGNLIQKINQRRDASFGQGCGDSYSTICEARILSFIWCLDGFLSAFIVGVEQVRVTKAGEFQETVWKDQGQASGWTWWKCLSRWNDSTRLQIYTSPMEPSKKNPNKGNIHQSYGAE